jgi:hypothetical protein
LGGQSHHGSQVTASPTTASSTLDNYPILIGNSSKHGKKMKSSHLLQIHWLRKHSVRILPAESNSNKQKIELIKCQSIKSHFVLSSKDVKYALLQLLENHLQRIPVGQWSRPQGP